jgi:hypothetical protein
LTASDASHYYGSVPGIDLEKHTNGFDADGPPGPYIEAGLAVTWTYLVTNTGNVTLTGVIVVDDQLGAIPCPESQLDARQTMTCTAAGIALPGLYANTGTATGTPPVGAPVTDMDLSHYLGSIPEVLLETRTNGQDADAPPGPYLEAGGPVTWTYAITNESALTLSNVVVTDSQDVDVSCPGTTLAPWAGFTCIATGTVAAGPYSNLGRVTALPPGGSAVTASDPSHYYGSAPGIALETRTNGRDADEAPGPYIKVGQPVTWTYRVTNTGNITLTGIVVEDDQGLEVSCPATTLAVDESMACQATDTALPGQYANVGSATGTPPVGASAEAHDPSHYYGAVLDISLEKQTNGYDADTPPGPFIEAGSIVRWTYMVANTGNVPLVDVVVEDDQGLAITCPSTTLAAGVAMTCLATGTADRAQYRNLGTVTARFEDWTVADWDTSHYNSNTASYLYLPLILR